MTDLRGYALVTGAYWGFTLTDGALRMLVLLHFHGLGYGALQIAGLFLLYEFCGILTNLLGGWLGSRMGLKIILFSGLGLQVFALAMLALLDPGWQAGFSLAYVMISQALSGIAKDLTKMSSKSAIKLLTGEGGESRLFKWVAVLTGSKNALKGVGFFLGGVLLASLGFAGALYAMAGALLAVLLGCVLFLKGDMGKSRAKLKFKSLLSKSPALNRLSLARFFLFGSRDLWFALGLPLFLSSALGWEHEAVGAALALWVIGYGAVQSAAPNLLRRGIAGGTPDGRTATRLAALLFGTTAALALLLAAGAPPEATLILGLAVFGAVFALNSSIHSYLVLAYSDADQVAANVGFYYMANAAGRLAGLFLSGVAYQWGSLVACLWGSAGFLALAVLCSLGLPAGRADESAS